MKPSVGERGGALEAVAPQRPEAELDAVRAEGGHGGEGYSSVSATEKSQSLW